MKTRLLAIAMVLMVALEMTAQEKKDARKGNPTKTSKVETELPYHLDYKVIPLSGNYSDDQKVRERNVLSIYVNNRNQYAIRKGMGSLSLCDIDNYMDAIVEFMTPRPSDASAPETEYITVNPIGKVLTTKGLIIFRFDPYAKTEDGYYAVINEMAKAYAALREDMAMKAFHKHLNQLNNEEHEAIRKAVPVRVVGIGEHLWVPQIEIVENDEEAEDFELNNALVETCIKKVDDLDGIKAIVEDFNRNKIEIDLEEEEIEMEAEIFLIVEEMPEFPGGAKNVATYLSQNIKYPAEAARAGIEGKVFVGFVVEPDGSISNVNILRGVPGLNEEAIRVVQSMPKWKPGKQRGQAVRVRYQMPVDFKLH